MHGQNHFKEYTGCILGAGSLWYTSTAITSAEGRR